MELIFLVLLKLCNFEMLNYLKATVIGFDSEQQNWELFVVAQDELLKELFIAKFGF